MKSVLLIHPPVAKPGEPPAGIARLCGALLHHGVRFTVLDANLEGLLHLLGAPGSPSDTWSIRAVRNLPANLATLRSWKGYRNLDRYKRAISDLNRLLEIGDPSGVVRVGLANLQHRELSPVRSEDLLRASREPEKDPFYGYFRKRLLDLIERESPSVVGFSLNFLSQALTTFAMIGMLRRECAGVEVVLGGGLVTSWVRRPGWQNPFGGLVDHLVAGPGESPLLSIAGVGDASDEPPLPDYNSLPLGDYLSPGLILPYSASSGCYWNRCAFCPERAEGNPYVPLPAGKVVRDLDILAGKMEPVLIHILDNAVSPSTLKAIARTPPGPPWYGFVRITSHFADLDFCVALKESGCAMLKLGLESGDQKVLDSMQKGTDLGVASLALQNLAKAGIATYVYLLFGTPSETLDEARKTLAFTAAHSAEIGFLNLALFNLPIYGPQARELETRLHYEGDLSLYTGFTHPKGWNRDVVRQFLDKEFRRHPSIASILRKDPPVFTSNHAPLFAMQQAVQAARHVRPARRSSVRIR